MNDEKNQGIIFIDLDTVITNSSENTATVDDLRKQYTNNFLREWDIPRFNQLTDDEVLIMASWDKDWCGKISQLRPDNTMVIMLTKLDSDPSHLNTMLEFNWIYRTTEFIKYDDDKTLSQAVRERLKFSEDPSRFVLISRNDYREDFHENAIFLCPQNMADLRYVKNRMNRILFGEPAEYFGWYSHGDHGEEENEKRHLFSKVIFLDIDGVLNDEGEEYDKGVIIDPEKVKLLKHIVQETDAEIILSSSWKHSYMDHVLNGRNTEDKKLNMLIDAFNNEHLKIHGITPISQLSGSIARPYEIRQWLEKYPDIFSYVILEDDTFWSWGYLQRNVVTTQTYNPERERYDQYVKGLTLEHVEKAVRILNEAGAMKSYI